MSVLFHTDPRPIAGTTRRSSAGSSKPRRGQPSGRPVRRRSAGSCPPDASITYLGRPCSTRRAASFYMEPRRPPRGDRTGCRRSGRGSAIGPRRVHKRRTRATTTASSRPASDGPMWKSNFGRPTLSTRRRPRSCVCSMAWMFATTNSLVDFHTVIHD